MADMLGVELARPGNWRLSSGRRRFDEHDLRDAADFWASAGQERIPIGFGHSDSRFDGEPAFGWVSNIRYAEDAKGPVLLGDLVDMEDWVAAAAPSRWPHRSIEGFANLDHDGRVYRLALTRLSLLGATPAAMPTLRTLADIKAAVSRPAPTSVAARAHYSRGSGIPIAASMEGAGMDVAVFREAMGLEDLSDDEVLEALAEAGFIPAAPVAASAVPMRGEEDLYHHLFDDLDRAVARLSPPTRAQWVAATAAEPVDHEFAHLFAPRTREEAWARQDAQLRQQRIAASAISDEDELEREIALLSPPRPGERRALPAPVAASAYMPTSPYGEPATSWLNPVEELRSTHPDLVAQAEARGPAPELFPGGGDYPLSTASGLPVAAVESLEPWRARVAATEQPNLALAHKIVQDYAGPDGEDASRVDLVNHPAVVQRLVDVHNWVNGAGTAGLRRY